jgi:hypothetical protein
MAKVKSKEQLEKEADTRRRAAVDATNKANAATTAAKEAELAKTPLTDEEKEFCARIAPLMNEGRAVMRPSAADITRYARLIKRKNVK